MKKIRLEDWDYSWNGIYFVTIKTENNRKYFGQILNNEMKLNKIGEIAEACWREVPNHYDHVYIDEFIIMPDHVHGLIRINNPNREQGYIQLKRKRKKILLSENNTDYNPSLLTIIGSYKSACSKIIRAETNCKFFSWQKRFNDEIICNDLTLMRVRDYIKNNPKNYRMRCLI